MQALKIVLLGLVSAVTYGILHDQVTARVCLEYFTIGHAPVFGTDDPTLLGLGWGILATWWVGVALGLALAVAARAGRRPKVQARTLLKPVGVLMAVAGVSALVAGVCGYFAARAGRIWLLPPEAYLVPEARHAAFLAAGCAHGTSYAIGFLGTLLLCVLTWRRRVKQPD